MRTLLSEVDLKCHAPKNDASLATNKQRNAEVKTKTNLATVAGGEGKTLFKMAAKHGVYNRLQRACLGVL